MASLTQGARRIPQHDCVTTLRGSVNSKLSTVRKKVQNRAYLLSIILVIAFGQVLILLRIGWASSVQKYRQLAVNSYHLIANFFSKTRFHSESYLHSCPGILS
jgi:hypothetical protein